MQPTASTEKITSDKTKKFDTKYVFAFLRNIYLDSFKAAFPPDFTIDNKMLNGIAGAWLLSSVS